MLTTYKKHLLANRLRRIPRRIGQLKTQILSLDKQVDEVENSDTSAEYKQLRIRRLRDSSGPLHAQIRALADRLTDLKVQLEFASHV